jgi:hypothetical protein
MALDKIKESFYTTSSGVKIKEYQKYVKNLKREKKIYAVAHFDLPSSTVQMRKNQPKAITRMLIHNKICRGIIEENNGNVIKELGDAVLATFSNTPSACECALKVIYNFKQSKLGITTKVTITAGTIEKILTANKSDVYGLPVNLCNRMAKEACANSITIEESRYQEVKYGLPQDPKIRFGRSRNATLADFGRVKLRQITLRC